MLGTEDEITNSMLHVLHGRVQCSNMRMENSMKKSLMFLLVVVSMAMAAGSAQAFTYSYSLAGLDGNVPTGDLLTAEFTDTGTGSVRLMLHTFLTGAYANFSVSKWYFNLSKEFEFAKLTFDRVVGSPAAISTTSYGFEFLFGSTSLKGTQTFEYKITGTGLNGAGLNAAAFNVPSDGREPYQGAYTYATLRKTSGSDARSVSIYDKTSISNVPEPGTFLLLGAGLVSLVGLSRKLKK